MLLSTFLFIAFVFSLPLFPPSLPPSSSVSQLSILSLNSSSLYLKLLFLIFPAATFPLLFLLISSDHLSPKSCSKLNFSVSSNQLYPIALLLFRPLSHSSPSSKDSSTLDMLLVIASDTTGLNFDLYLCFMEHVCESVVT